MLKLYSDLKSVLTELERATGERLTRRSLMGPFSDEDQP